MARDIRLNNVRYSPELNAIEYSGGVNKRILVYLDQIILSFKEGVANYAALPLTGNEINDARITNNDGHLYVWNGTSWVDQGDIIDLGWSAISGGPTSTPADIDDSVAKRHTQNTDTKLDNGQPNQVTAAELRSHVDSTSNPHSVTKTQVGLGNVTNDAQLKAANLDTDGTLATNSDLKIASQKAVKTYVDNQTAGAGISDSERLNLFANQFDAWLQINNSANWTSMTNKSMLRPGLVLDTVNSLNFMNTDGTNATPPTTYIQSRAFLVTYFQCEGTGNVTSANLSNGAYVTINTYSPQNIPTYDTTNFKVGTSSILFNGTTQAITYGSSNRRYYDLSNNDFTISTWVRLGAVPGTFCISSRGFSTSDKSWSWNILSDRLRFQYSTDGSTMNNLDSNTGLSWSTGVWYHLEICRVGSTIYFFRDGVAVGTASIGSTTIRTATAANGFWGEDSNGNINFFNGNMDEIRMYNGRGLDTSNFTPDTTVLTNFDIGDMTAYYPTISTTIVPTKAYAIFYMNNTTDAPTLGTDIKIYASRDNGVTYTELTNYVDLKSNSGSQCYGVYGNISSQPSGSIVKYKWQTFNNKRFRIGQTCEAWA